ncbi:hypothetical protein [Burkholderia oklahomensis]|uniref:hypothetical protein n=1 Tax=Burkholderia oklahomensis TaxID=342113 RepID=UPI00057229F9|nr:hypothetical protein [Burkholderia oklahomensis]AJX33307.1 hypothetical protein BG90_610 [Burkholderia oklahomensis C6786]AOI46771.1 hypothetical protein WI23_13835 [Burkholderia oklahomensis C6786]KUY62947.1 hypothetical protein WI23_08730 [Burkholderia oklahomensis C6786]MBI0360584.1 hypothetical protein [Burkholderia oklahomensis]SUW59964.1 Uncharacterised protein [Burkholderia oklahomensis]
MASGDTLRDMFRILSQQSDPASCLPSEDVVGYVQCGSSFKAWAIDGGSHLTECPFTTFDDFSDAHWFAAALSDFLANDLRRRDFDTGRLRLALNDLRRQYVSLAPSTPLWAYPVAACTIAEVRHMRDHVAVDVYHYADCFAMFAQHERRGLIPGDRSWSSIEPRAMWQPCSGFSGEKLHALRQRRIRQQHNQGTTALTLNPDSAANATHLRQSIVTPCHMLIGTDGISRAWEHYGLMGHGDVMKFLAAEGLGALFARLRGYERQHVPDGMKPHDDAAALHVLCL